MVYSRIVGMERGGKHGAPLRLQARAIRVTFFRALLTRVGLSCRYLLPLAFCAEKTPPAPSFHAHAGFQPAGMRPSIPPAPAPPAVKVHLDFTPLRIFK